MNPNDRLKIGISIGEIRGQRQFQTPVENPTYALHRANEIIHSNFNPNFSLFFVEVGKSRRKSRRRN